MMAGTRQGGQDPTQSVWFLLAGLCRVLMIGLGIAGLLPDAISRVTPMGLGVLYALAACDVAIIVAPLLRWRVLPLIVGLVTLGTHRAVLAERLRTNWDLWYLGIAVVFLLLPRGGSRGERA